ncbi:MAG: hypothetical protein Q8P18_02710 [Pseudomonadota bacterium]|nr:hypothetical protein [Pseudomonadota bacterium]
MACPPRAAVTARGGRLRTSAVVFAFGGGGAASWDLDADGGPAWWLPGAYDAIRSPETDCDDDDDEVYPGRGC